MRGLIDISELTIEEIEEVFEELVFWNLNVENLGFDKTTVFCVNFG